MQYYTVTLNWDIGENLRFESITSAWEMHRRSFVDYDGSEFTFTIDENRSIDNNFTQEFHLSGSNFDDRVTWLAGLYSLDEKTKSRADRWAVWDLPRRPGNLSVAPDPRDRMSVAACQYLYNWATTVYNTAPQATYPAGGPCATTGTTPNTIGTLNPAIWTMNLAGIEPIGESQPRRAECLFRRSHDRAHAKARHDARRARHGRRRHDACRLDPAVHP